MSLRIGRNIIDTREWSTEDYDTIIRDLRKERARKLKAEELTTRMKELIIDAKENGFTFIDKDFGQVWQNTDFTLYDERT